MDGLIRFSLRNPYAITVLMLAIVIIGGLSLTPFLRTFCRSIAVLQFKSLPSTTACRRRVWKKILPLAWNDGLDKRAEPPGKNRDRSSALASSETITETMSILAALSPRSTRWRRPLSPTFLLEHFHQSFLPYDPTSVTPVCLIALGQPFARRIDPLRCRSIPGAQHDHGLSRCQRTRRLRRKTPNRPGILSTRRNASTQPLPHRCHASSR